MSDSGEFVIDLASESNKVPQRGPSQPGASFPYANLEDAVGVVKAMHDGGGVPMARDQIAMQMNTVPDNSTFAAKLGAAQMFGLIAKADGRNLELTQLGNSVLAVDEAELQNARVAAFLNVDLYKKLVDHYRGRILPPRDGLEKAMVSFGVAPKQRDRARQTFERSAIYAGYMNAAKDRLVPPIILQAAALDPRNMEPARTADAPPTIAGALLSKMKDNDPAEEKLIRGMLDRLPPIGEPWPVADRARWLRRFAHNLAMVYDPDDDAEIEVRIAHEMPPIRANSLPVPPAPNRARANPENAPNRGALADDDAISFTGA